MVSTVEEVENGRRATSSQEAGRRVGGGEEKPVARKDDVANEEDCA